MKYLSFLIIGLVALVTFSLAGLILYVSVTDTHSNYHIAVGLVDDFVNSLAVTAQTVATSSDGSSASSATSSSAQTIVITVACATAYNDGICHYKDPITREACSHFDPDCEICATEGWNVSNGCDGLCPNPTTRCPSPRDACKIRPEQSRHVSLVNFLHERKMPFTFVNRIALARAYNIEHYQGTAEQNSLLLRTLVAEELAEHCEKSRSSLAP